MPDSTPSAHTAAVHPTARNHPVTAIDLPVSGLAGVGSKIEGQLEQLGITRLFELLLHLPRDYEDRSRLVNMHQLQDGQLALVEGQVTYVDNKRSGMTVTIEDDTASIQLRFFKVYRGLTQTMTLGTRLRVFGEVKINRYGVQMMHPEYSVVSANAPVVNTGLQPIYPTVKGLHQNKLRTLVKLALQTVHQQGVPITVFTESDWQAIANLPAPLPTDFQLSGSNSNTSSSSLSADSQKQSWQSLTLFEALTLVHTPPMHTDISKQVAQLTQLKERAHPACQRLIIEELTAHQLSMLYRRKQLHQHKAPKCDSDSPLSKRLLADLPFDLTSAQSRVINEITRDMATSIPMLRLIQGDVGAGKTLVAALAACYALDSGWQVAVMAPTEILAEQHLINFKAWFEPLDIGVGWLAGKQTAKQRREALADIVDNTVQIVVGTHALFQESVVFAKLGLAIIDEQHRFGVEQRMALTSKGVADSTPHQLIMTATPIPRTLAMSAYGDMDTSIIDELPPGRTPITTVTIDRARRDDVIERIAANCAEGKQAYWVCPLVDDSNTLNAQAAEATYADLQQRLDIRIGMVHGKMKSKEKLAVMTAFKNAELDLLVATTVIEVGVDVPNASLMVIENAERLGLSQLHQLRGRVGRGSTKSYCVLLYQTPLSETGIERLNVLRDSNDGFVIAQKDLELRGPGELLGKRQTGNVGYYVSDLSRDENLLMIASHLAKRLIDDDIRKADVTQLIHRWMPEASRYTNV